MVLLPPSRKLGVGNLRHLFLDGWQRSPSAVSRRAHLVKTWIEQAPADGVRTVCGIDGNATGLDRDGWRYFGYYNKGESVSDSWAFGYLDEYIENCPVTAAYGSTTREALGSLLTGRFTDQRAEAKAVAISDRAGLAVPVPAERSVAPITNCHSHRIQQSPEWFRGHHTYSVPGTPYLLGPNLTRAEGLWAHHTDSGRDADALQEWKLLGSAIPGWRKAGPWRVGPWTNSDETECSSASSASRVGHHRRLAVSSAAMPANWNQNGIGALLGTTTQMVVSETFTINTGSPRYSRRRVTYPLPT